MSERSEEPRSWEESEDVDRILSQLRDQIESLRAKMRVYRSVVEGDKDESRNTDP